MSLYTAAVVKKKKKKNQVDERFEYDVSGHVKPDLYVYVPCSSSLIFLITL